MGWLKEAQSDYWKDDPIFGRIVDHNARAEVASKPEAKQMKAEAKKIIDEAHGSGHYGLGMDERGRIVKRHVTTSWETDAPSVNDEVIRAWTKPFSNEMGRKSWEKKTNIPEPYVEPPIGGTGRWYRSAPSEGSKPLGGTRPPTIRGEDRDTALSFANRGLDLYGKEI